MANDPNGWPFIDRPGVPLNPERDGWHWLAWDPAWPEPAYWDGEWSRSDTSNLSVRTARYLGPMHTPAEVAALVAAGQEGMREACARAAMVEIGWNAPKAEVRKAIAMQAAHTVNAIRERPLPDAAATLDRVRAEERAKVWEEAAGIVETHAAAAKRCSEEADVIYRIRAEYLAKAFALNTAAADIRARAAQEKQG